MLAAGGKKEREQESHGGVVLASDTTLLGLFACIVPVWDYSVIASANLVYFSC